LPEALSVLPPAEVFPESRNWRGSPDNPKNAFDLSKMIGHLLFSNKIAPPTAVARNILALALFASLAAHAGGNQALPRLKIVLRYCYP
jgi:hypothetical protein